MMRHRSKVDKDVFKKDTNRKIKRKIDKLKKDTESKLDELKSNFASLSTKTQSKIDEVKESSSRNIADKDVFEKDTDTKIQRKIDKLKKDLMSTTESKQGGAIYVRWGRTTCPTDGTDMVYSGFSGGAHYLHKGGGAEYLCLPKDPIFGDQVPLPHSGTGYIYGAEYESPYFGQPQQQDVPCAVCRSTINTNSIMIPSRNKCYKGWKLEYHGRLASGYYDHPSATQYVCVDDKPEVLHAGNPDDNGKLFYPVRAKCGSLKCPPYDNDKLFLCVVCTK